MIKIEIVFAMNDTELQDKLNDIRGRLISVQHLYDYEYKVIYEQF